MIDREYLAAALATGTPWTPGAILEALERAEDAGLTVAEAAALIASADTGYPHIGDAVWAALYGRKIRRSGALYVSRLRGELRRECPYGL